MGMPNTKDLARELIYIRECRDNVNSVRIDKDSWVVTGGNDGHSISPLSLDSTTGNIFDKST